MHGELLLVILPCYKFIYIFVNILVIVDFVCRVLTPYYTEEVLFSLHDLDSPNEDGVSILFYLQKIFPGSPLTPNLFSA